MLGCYGAMNEPERAHVGSMFPELRWTESQRLRLRWMSIRTDPNNPFVAAAVAWNGKTTPEISGIRGQARSAEFVRMGTHSKTV